MYEDFRAIHRWTKEEVHCTYQAVILAIATRHADAVDIKFLINDRPVWIALPHPAWTEYTARTGKVITDPLAVQIAGHYLKTIIENGEESGREMYALTVNETLEHLDAVLSEHHRAVPA
jgi:TPP-dependent 2-oxoacid decarboxylase